MKKKYSNILRITNRILGGVLIVAIVAIPFIWPHIRFDQDFKAVKSIFSHAPGSNPFDKPLLSISFKTPIPLTPNIDNNVNNFRLSNSNCVFETDKIKMIIGDSIIDSILILNKSHVSFLANRSKNSEIIAFQKLKDPFEKFKKVLESDLNGITNAKNLSSKYLELYLYGLKATLLPREEAAVEYNIVESGNFKGFQFGNIEKSDVKLILYSLKYNHFYSILLLKKD
jgi:hypothetical protein